MKGHKANEVANLINRAYADRPLRDLIADGQEVADLVNHPGWVMVEAVLDQLAEASLFDIDARSRPLEQAQYAQKHGFRNGLRVVADVVETYRQEAERAVQAIETEASRPEAAERT